MKENRILLKRVFKISQGLFLLLVLLMLLDFYWTIWVQIILLFIYFILFLLEQMRVYNALSLYLKANHPNVYKMNGKQYFSIEFLIEPPQNEDEVLKRFYKYLVWFRPFMIKTIILLLIEFIILSLIK